MINVRITGRSSFIGGAVAGRLGEFPGAYRTDLVSLRGNAWRTEGFRGADCVVHCAGIAHIKPDPGMEGEYMRVNRDLAIEAARRAKADGAAHFIFLSSIIVYGEASPAGERKVIGPDTPTAPANFYGKSKLEAEQGILALADENFTVSVIRPPMVYGKGCKGNYNTLSALARKLPLFPAMENHRSAIYVGNLAECIRLIIDGRLGGIFCPQDESITSTRAIAERIAHVHGKKMRFMRGLDPLVRLMGRRGVVRRAFGDMAYDLSMSEMPGNYRIFDPDTSIRNTEIH